MPADIIPESTTTGRRDVHHLAPLMGAFVLPQGCGAFFEPHPRASGAAGAQPSAPRKRQLADRWWRWLAGSAVVYPGGATAQLLLATDEG